MTTYIQRQVQLQVAEDQSGRNQLIKRGYDAVTRFDAIAALKEAELKRYDLQAPLTDHDLLASTSISAGKILYIEANGPITIKLGTTGDTGIAITPLDSSDTTKRAVFYYEGTFTHVYVTIGGTSLVEVLMGVVGA